jgi:hypothetical protein
MPQRARAAANSHADVEDLTPEKLPRRAERRR